MGREKSDRYELDMSWMFEIASQFNHDIGGWDVSHAAEMDCMFIGATSYR